MSFCFNFLGFFVDFLFVVFLVHLSLLRVEINMQLKHFDIPGVDWEGRSE